MRSQAPSPKPHAASLELLYLGHMHARMQAISAPTYNQPPPSLL